MAWDSPLVSWGQLSWLYPLPASCPPPAHVLRQQSERLDAIQALFSQDIGVF